MPRNDTFTREIGAVGKELVTKYFIDKGYSIYPATGNPIDYIDFIAERKGKRQAICVRTDTRISETKNVCVERFMHRRGENDIEYGWMFTGKADILCYLDADQGHLYFYRWLPLKKYVVENCKPQSFLNPYDEMSVGDAYFVPTHTLEKTNAFIMHTMIDVSPMMKFNFKRTNPF